MVRIFDRNMFIMLLTIMVGAIIISYFVADIVNKSTLEEQQKQHEVEIEKIESENENFTSYFIRATVELDKAREDRSFGNYHFDLAFIWYQTSLSEENITKLELYKFRGIDNCTKAMEKYNYSRDNFKLSKDFFNDIKNYTDNKKYLEILDIYENLTYTGYNLTKLRIKACEYLRILTENLIIDEQTGNITFMENVSDILLLFEDLMGDISDMEDDYDKIQDKIDDFEFDETREPG